MKGMSSRERFMAALNFQPCDRLPVVEWAPWWDKTVERWRGEGMPAELSGRDIDRWLGLDVIEFTWVGSDIPDLKGPREHGAGVIENMDDYERLKSMLPSKGPLPEEQLEWWRYVAGVQAKGEATARLGLDGFFWWPRKLFGIERHLYAFYDHPELMHRINSDLAEWNLRAIDEMCRIAVPDFVTIAEDMSYNHGPMISKELFDEFMRPYYLKVMAELKSRGIVAIVDSDGDVTVPAAWFLDAGVDGILPLERQSGLDVAALRRLHPRMRLIGAFDKMTMTRGEAAMRAEFERLLPVAAEGGFIISCDHQTPPGVSLEEYRVYLRLFREYAEKAAR